MSRFNWLTLNDAETAFFKARVSSDSNPGPWMTGTEVSAFARKNNKKKNPSS